ncbi:MAG: 8-amino-7-oxononanoate synthase [Paracoccaceae bacterium]|jgi:8-amino-7-oxononanoate synthase
MSGEGLASDFAAEVAQWRERGLGRALGKASVSTSAKAVDFTSNDYLGLAKHPAVIAAAVRATEEHGAGGRASRLLGGGAPGTRKLELRFADWLGAESALLMPSGYQANVTLLPAIAGQGDVIVSDELNHASLIDAMRLSRATVHVYGHGDVDHAARLLAEASSARRRYLVTESIFSMDGDLAPLAELEEAAANASAGLIVDEAHAIGVIGEGGRGGCSAAGVMPLARIVTGGKSLGSAGGFIIGAEALIDLLVHRGRGFVFSTAVMPGIVGALGAALGLVHDANEARARLRKFAGVVARAAGAATPDGAIVPVPIGDPVRAVAAQAALASEGFDVRAVRPPTVPDGTARLRVVCRSDHTEESVAGLAAALDGQGGLGAREALVQEVPVSESSPRPLVIVGTDTDIGKTVVSAAAALALDAWYWKPVQTGDDSDTLEVERLAGPLQSPLQGPSEGDDAAESGRAIAPPRYAFRLPASPHTAAAVENASIDVDELEIALERHRRAAAPRRLVVELAGGWLVPLVGDVTQADWISRPRGAESGLDVLLVARSSLGTLNHTLLTLEALRSRGVTPRALVLVGEPHEANAATLRGYVPHLFELPRLERLDRDALEAWLSRHPLKDALDHSLSDLTDD